MCLQIAMDAVVFDTIQATHVFFEFVVGFYGLYLFSVHE